MSCKLRIKYIFCRSCHCCVTSSALCFTSTVARSQISWFCCQLQQTVQTDLGTVEALFPVALLYSFFSLSQCVCVASPSVCVYIFFSSRCSLSSFWLFKSCSFRMVGDDDDEGTLSDSDGKSGLAADDLASK